MKKFIKNLTKIIVCTIIISLLGGCSKIGGKNNTIYTSFFALEDVTREIVGNKIKVETIIPSGQSIHSWEPSAQDMVKLKNSKLLIINGLDLEPWIYKLSSSLKDVDILSASKNTLLLEVGEENENNDKVQIDPHVWLSLKNMEVMSENIFRAVVKMDKENADFYSKNYNEFIRKLRAIDSKYSSLFKNSTKKSVITSHEAFGYLFNDFGLKQVPIQGINSEGEPNLTKMKDIIEFAKKENINTIFAEAFEESKVEDVLAKEISGKVKSLYTAEVNDENNKKSYLEMMEENLKLLIEATK